MINLPLNHSNALNLTTRMQKGQRAWRAVHEILEKEQIERVENLSFKIFRKIALFTDLEMEEIPPVNFSIRECRLIGLLTYCCDRPLEKGFFKPMNQQLIALGKSPVIIRGYSEWRYMWKELKTQDGHSMESMDWFLLYMKSDLDKGHLFKCTNDKLNKDLSLAVPFSKTFKRAMGMQL